MIVKFEGEVRGLQDGSEFMYVLTPFRMDTGKQLQESLWIGPFVTEEEALFAGEIAVNQAIEGLKEAMGGTEIKVTREEETIH